METAVSARGIVKDFPSGDEVVRVLHGIDLDIKNGELTMLVGPSGCGKTTLLSIITGILSTTKGQVMIGGTELTALDDNDKVHLRRRQMGMIFQQYNLLTALTAAENASVTLVADDVPLTDAEAHVSGILDKMGMGAHLDKLPSQLSGGQQQRVAIARALAHEPRLIVCDEPTAALDAAAGHAVMETLRQIALTPGRAVIVVTHDPRIFEFADRIIYMSDGRIEREETRSH